MTFRTLLCSLVLISTVAADTLEEARKRFVTPPDDSRIMMRWWWFGPSATHDQIEAEMRKMKEGGIGGFEVQPVYPLSLEGNYAWLSPQFLDALKFTSQKAKELGLRMDLTLGSGWSFGGPYITPDLASHQLRWEHYEIAPSVTSIAKPAPREGEKLLGVYVGRGSTREADGTSFQSLDTSEPERVSIPLGDGPRTLSFVFQSHTGQVVKRAAVGAEGYVLDHYNRAAIEKHLKEAGDKMLAAVGPGGVHSIFCDSLEVYEANWTPDLPGEFRKRRGYDLLPLLPMLEFDGGDKSAALRRDFGRTLSELYEERFLVPMRDWSKKNNVLFRAQNYGAPPATIASHKHLDLIDGEGWHWRRLTSTRWAASAAHIYGKPVVASEAWTWIHSPVFRATPLDIKAEADQQFLNGVTQLIGHGWPYSPPQSGDLGWAFYAAGVFNDRNPWWPVMPNLSTYLQRLSYLLRQGESVADVAIYAPTDDAYATFKTGSTRNLDLFRKTEAVVGTEIIPAILDAGYAFDIIDDGTLDLAGKRYKAILLPNVRSMPAATAKWLQAYQQGGGTVLAYGRKPDAAWTNLELVTAADLAARLGKTVPADVKFAPASPDLGFVHRRLPDGDLYFVANTANVPKTFTARFGTATANSEVWDPLAGTIRKLESKAGQAALTLEPYSSRVIVFAKNASTAEPNPLRTSALIEDLKAGWTVQVGNDKVQVALPHSWADSPQTKGFSGGATYTRTIDLKPGVRTPGARLVLDFGTTQTARRDTPPEGSPRADAAFAALIAAPIRDAAIVTVNGKAAGTVWAPPYKIDLTDHLKDGPNDIQVQVFNTAINKLVAGGAQQPDYKALVEKYGLRFRMQELEAIEALPSGIVGAPRLVAERVGPAPPPTVAVPAVTPPIAPGAVPPKPVPAAPKPPVVAPKSGAVTPPPVAAPKN